MSQSVTAAFLQPEMMSQMLKDYSKIDFEIIKEQGSWVCECPLSILTQICTFSFQVSIYFS